jgi:dihydroflavonol-4-reductase
MIWAFARTLFDMPTAFITGATGFLGGHLARLLSSRGYQVRALVRPTACYDTLKSTPIDIVLGDLSQPGLLKKAMKGCELVFHAAADYRLWTRNPAEMYASNVEGTRNLLQAAWDEKVPKIVYTSTVGTIGLNADRTPADESSFLKMDARTGHYKRSKFLAEQVALEFAQKGLPVVIVNPSAPIGSHDWKPTPTGRIVVDFLEGKMPMYLDTGLNLVDVEDVAEGHWLAAQKGRVGERYILGNANLSLREILGLLSQITDIPAPRMRCPYALALVTAWISEGLTWMLDGKEPRVPREGVYMAKNYMFFDSQKAIQELGYRPGEVIFALKKAVVWFVENGYVQRPLPPSFDPKESPIAGVGMGPDAIAIPEPRF